MHGHKSTSWEDWDSVDSQRRWRNRWVLGGGLEIKEDRTRSTKSFSYWWTYMTHVNTIWMNEWINHIWINLLSLLCFSVRADVEYALHTLGVSYLDIIVLCRVPHDTPIEVTVAAMHKVKKDDQGQCMMTPCSPLSLVSPYVLTDAEPHPFALLSDGLGGQG